MSYAFGQDITYKFYPLLDNADATISSTVQSQTPNVYVFDETVPTRIDASTGTNSIQSITSWNWNSTGKYWSFTISAVDDPDPDSNVPVRIYWVAINFILQVGEQVQKIIKPLQLERVVGHDRTVTVTDKDLETYFPQIVAYSSDVQRKAYIRQATEEVKANLRMKGYEWAKIQRADRLDVCVIYKALAMILLAQVQEPNDKFFIKYQEFKNGFLTNIDSLKIEYQAMEAGSLSEARTTGSILIAR